MRQCHEMRAIQCVSAQDAKTSCVNLGHHEPIKQSSCKTGPQVTCSDSCAEGGANEKLPRTMAATAMLSRVAPLCSFYCCFSARVGRCELALDVADSVECSGCLKGRAECARGDSEVEKQDTDTACLDLSRCTCRKLHWQSTVFCTFVTFCAGAAEDTMAAGIMIAVLQPEYTPYSFKLEHAAMRGCGKDRSRKSSRGSNPAPYRRLRRGRDTWRAAVQVEQPAGKPEGQRHLIY